MRDRRLSLHPAFALLLVLSAAPVAKALGQTSSDPTAARKPAAKSLRTLRSTIERIARESRGRLGAGIELLETGDQLISGGNGRHPMQSVYKLHIAMAVLHEVDRGTVRLDQPVAVSPRDFISPGQRSPIRDDHPNGVSLAVRELIRFAVSESDGVASDVLLRLAGGAARVTAYLQEVGVRDVAVVTTEQEMGRNDRAQFRNWTTRRGALAVLRAVQGRRALSDSSRACCSS